FFSSSVPWMACPFLSKETACGIGALSHCLLYQISFIEVAVKVPAGVEYPALPADTGQLYCSIPSTQTVMCCVDLSMVISTFDPESSLETSGPMALPRSSFGV